jgi:UDP-N-acetylglucosamine 3-dehydrogenase
MLKVAVIGLGAMGQHHARLYSQLTETGLPPRSVGGGPLGQANSSVQLVAVVDANLERAKDIGSKYGVPFYSNSHDLLGKVDAVSIAVPTTLHYAISVDFLKAGVHCLVEKPIASTLKEAEDIIAAAKLNKVKVAIGHIERFNPAVLKLKEIIDEGTLGQLLILSTRRVGPSVPRIRDVGVTIDSATHDIGVVKYLIGKSPVSVYSRVGSLKHPKDDHAIIVLDFDKTTACIEVNWFTPHKVRTLVATGSEGIAYLDYIEQKVTVHTANQSQVVNIQKQEPLKLELEDFLQSIIEDREPSVNGEEGMEVLKIALEASSSSSYASQLILHRKV